MPYKDPEVRKAYLKSYNLNHLQELSEYHKRYHKENKEVILAKTRAWRIDNPEKYAEQLARQSARNKGKPNWLLKKRLTRAEYDAMLVLQGGCCGLCKRPFSEDNPPVLDHCHLTNKNRGLLHSACNLGIGHFKDDPVVCELAAEYLRRTNEKVSIVDATAFDTPSVG